MQSQPTPKRTLLFVVDRGGYPLHSEMFVKAGYEVLLAPSTRKGLALLKSVSPDVIVAEFNYGPRYGVLISNLEPLLALVQTKHPRTKVITLVEKEFLPQLDRLQNKFSIYDALTFPLVKQALWECVERAMGG